MSNPIEALAVQRAAEIAEGMESLAVYLGVAPSLIAAWIRGSTDVPPAEFLKVVEVIVVHAAPRMRGAIPPSLVQTFKHRTAANG